MENDHLDIQATSDRLHALANAELLDAEELKSSLGFIGLFPNREAWAKFLDRALLILGAAFIVSGIISFFAFNWVGMNRFVKFGLLGLLILVGVSFASYRRIADLPGKISLTAAAFLVGALIAIIDQSYPSGPGGGAESYQLFLGWAALIAGWAAIGRFIPLWFLLLALLNQGVIAYWIQVLGGVEFSMYAALVGLNTIAVLAWEMGRKAEIEWIKSRWAPRIAGLLIFAYLVISTVEFIFDLRSSPKYRDLSLPPAPILFLITSGVTLYYYSRRQLDLFLLATASFSLIAVITAFVIQGMEFDAAGEFLLIGVLILAQTAVAVRWLRRVDESSEVMS